MIKSELIAKLAAENPHLTRTDVERVSKKCSTPDPAWARRAWAALLGASVRGRRAVRPQPRTGESVAVDAKAVPSQERQGARGG